MTDQYLGLFGNGRVTPEQIASARRVREHAIESGVRAMRRAEFATQGCVWHRTDLGGSARQHEFMNSFKIQTQPSLPGTPALYRPGGLGTSEARRP